MTTEEFTNHLMVALHGPRASEIVDRILAVAAPSLGPIVVEASEETNGAVFEVAVLAHLLALKADDPRQAMALHTRRMGAAKAVRKRIQAYIQDLPDSEALAKAIMLGTSE